MIIRKSNISRYRGENRKCFGDGRTKAHLEAL